jgi:hypothetical protein
MPDEITVHQARKLPSAFIRFLLLEDAFTLSYVLGAFILEKMLVPRAPEKAGTRVKRTCQEMRREGYGESISGIPPRVHQQLASTCQQSACI